MPRLDERAEALLREERVSVDALGGLVGEILVAAGVSEQDAAKITQAMLHAEVRGADTHGVYHLPLYVRRLLDGSINARPDMRLEANSRAGRVLDADNGLGVLAGIVAIDALIPLARENGIAAVAVRNSNHFGVAGYFAEKAAQAGLVCLCFSNAGPSMNAWGGARQMLGTNPVAAAFPRAGGEPILVDLATTAVAKTRIRQAEKDGVAIPADWAFDRHGKPTTDPTEALAGSMQPMGGARGFALTLVVEMLSASLSGGVPGVEVIAAHDKSGRPAGVSHLFIGMDPAGFSGALYDGPVEKMARAVETSPAVDPESPVRLPGARGHAERRVRLAEGVPIKSRMRKPLIEAAKMVSERRGGA